ncbi:DUF1428 domain-containing protein [Chitinimonas taiwanensis]|jgi:uncharacterized protein YbaA (DUF1428 family)|uniref:Uncharacterized conserved protein YbaA, DUF1428 family n=1 Tax=Chitinimonas taiwanensis DSM 18899 TaxID=1121279 RepID=A0A1K2HS05_9NEIS|nr:DUF1428 domain-containing protein [Chitinimonas taiwanensis]SFZ79477.1 Uncharacterized conserved protein YbaA, DUF1428 family [Chitinimonas taiwanensis DSM 18899]
MEQYVDGFLIPLPKDKLAEYQQMANLAGEVWMSHGALAYYECLGDDLQGEGTVSFLQSAQSGPDETVVMAWIVYPSRAERERINAAVMADPRMAPMMQPDQPAPFDCKRMAYGGFRTLVALERK